MMLSDVCLSRTSGLSRETERPKKTKIGTEVAHVTLGHHFQGQKVKDQGHSGRGHIVATSDTACLVFITPNSSTYVTYTMNRK